jgi:hypothetical protein
MGPGIFGVSVKTTGNLNFTLTPKIRPLLFIIGSDLQMTRASLFNQLTHLDRRGAIETGTKQET